jgi:hypothetical protein
MQPFLNRLVSVMEERTATSGAVPGGRQQSREERWMRSALRRRRVSVCGTVDNGRAVGLRNRAADPPRAAQTSAPPGHLRRGLVWLRLTGSDRKDPVRSAWPRGHRCGHCAGELRHGRLLINTRPSPGRCRSAASAHRCGHLLLRSDANLARLNERPAKRGKLARRRRPLSSCRCF